MSMCRDLTCWHGEAEEGVGNTRGAGGRRRFADYYASRPDLSA